MPANYHKFIGWSPDNNTQDDGVVTDCQNLMPTLGGFKAAESLVTSAYPPLAATCQGAGVIYKIDDTTRLIAGTATNLYEGAGGAWNVVGSGYGGSVDTKWRYAQFGNVTIATNKTDPIQASLSGAFTSIGGQVPKAAIVETAANFVLAFDTTDGVNGDLPDRWACSALGDYTHWPSSPPTLADASGQAAFGRLLSSPGHIRAAKALGDNVIAYKRRSMFFGQYVGPPNVWSFVKMAGEVGTVCNESIVTTNAIHFFIGPDDFYFFDGTHPQVVPNPLRKWFFQNLNSTYDYRIQGYHDRKKANVYWYFPSNNSSDGTIDSCIVFNYRENKWGRADKRIEAVLDFISSGLTWDQLGSVYQTWDDLPAIPYDSPFWIPNALAPSVFDTTHTMKSLTGAALPLMVQTHDIGDDDQVSAITRVRPRFLVQQAITGSATLAGRMDSSANWTNVATSQLTSGKFDLMNSARWHRAQMNFTSEVELVGFTEDSQPESDE